MSERIPYPRRPSHFAHRFVRVLHKSCAAQDIGQAACYMLCIVAHTEDAGRFAGPARFWRSQLMETLGFKSPKQLVNARNKAMEAGWLVYHQAGTRAVGEYHVTIPTRFSGLSDSPLEPGTCGEISSVRGTNSGTNEAEPGPGLVPLETHKRNGNGSISGTQSGPLPIPSPIPIPKREAAPPSPDGGHPSSSKKSGSRFQPPTLNEVSAYCLERTNGIDAQQFIDHYTANGWKVGRNPMKDWKAAVRTWERNGIERGRGTSPAGPSIYAELSPRPRPGFPPAEVHRGNGKAHQ